MTLGLVLPEQRAQACECCRALVMHYSVSFREPSSGAVGTVWYPGPHQAPCGGWCARSEGLALDSSTAPGGRLVWRDRAGREVRVHLDNDGCAHCYEMRREAGMCL